ncbi:hypothetical protein HPP92_028263 [Vanilla planifolia]|uniref:Uncharacterized protein n=1 Tax=Vanilla planifolia TaxID=51239 RepID=A0A835U4I6_VANPL|nr:hypothetical protein HPP92_028263 [Vanilla planifolia]
MGLQECAGRLVGNWHLRGISGGEKKRLCIGLEILTQPPLLFLDEPTSGLDSAAAFFIVQTLKQMATDGNKTIISSIHQPSSEVFALFDDLYLLSGGETVYFGDAKLATEFFREVGLPCPSRRNPSDHFLRCTNSDFDRVNATLKGSMKTSCRMFGESSSDPLLNLATAEIKAMLVERYKTSDYAEMAKREITRIANLEGKTMEFNKGSLASCWKQLKTLVRRSITNMSRDIGYYWLRIVIYIVVSLCVGSVYFDVGTGYTAILARASCGSFISGFMTFMSIGGFPSFVEEIKVFYHERKSGHYGVAVYILSNFLSSLPFLVAVSLATATITYFMVKFQKDFPHYAYFTISIYTGISVVESIMMIVASLVPNFLMGIITGAGIMGIIMMTAGFFRTLRDLPKVLWRYPISYVNYGAWLLQGNYKNDFIGSTFDPLITGDAKLSGEFILQDTFGISTSHSKWLDLLAAAIILLVYRLLFFFILKTKERLSPLMWKLNAKASTLQQWRKASFKERKSSFVARKASREPMALQEGMGSPLP